MAGASQRGQRLGAVRARGGSFKRPPGMVPSPRSVHRSKGRYLNMPAVQVDRTEVKSADSPDETRTPPNALVQQVTVGGHTLARLTFRPGWKWSENIKPIVGTDKCQLSHVGYALSGSITVQTAEGPEQRVKAGDFYTIAPGHDAWNDSSQDFVGLEIVSQSAETYAKPT
jgi:hypothetical protein